MVDAGTGCLCGSEGGIRLLADLGPQPVCNRFLRDPGAPEFTHPMRLGQCPACGLLQLLQPPPVAELRPRYDWIKYNEPEGHLDRLADTLAGLPGLDKKSVVAGISFKDDTLLRRLAERGLTRTWRVDPGQDLGITHAGAGVETVQSRIDSGTVASILSRRGPADVLIARHIWEHAHDLSGFIRALGALLREGGYLVVEVPDCSRALGTRDYATLWEEHVAYFTPETFRYSLAAAGFDESRYECYPYPFENSMVGIVQAASGEARSPARADVAEETARASAFVHGLPEQRIRVRALLSEHRRGDRKIAFFGAGHLACVFINLLEIRDLVDFVADDHPSKQGLYMPGSRVPIRPSADLLAGRVSLCLLSLSPESESKVIAAHSEFVKRGGQFKSIIPSSRHALLAGAA